MTTMNGAVARPVDGSRTAGPPGFHVVNRRRWRVGSAQRRMTPRRGAALGLIELSVCPPPPSTPSAAEALVATASHVAARRVLLRACRRIGRLAGRRDRWAARGALLRRRAAEPDDVSVAPSGAAEDAATRQRLHDHLAERVERSYLAGEYQHRRAGRGHRRAARLLPWIDAVLFGYFVAGISNANLAAPWTTPVASFVVLVFAALAVLTVAAFTPWLGRYLRRFKDRDGEIDWALLGPIPTTLIGLWLVLAVAIAATMVVRVVTEAGYAGASAGGTVSVAAFLGAASLAMIGYVLAVAVADGTATTDDLCTRQVSIRRVARSRARLLRRAVRCELRHRSYCQRVQRARARALDRAESRLRAGDRVVDLLRLRTGAPVDRPRPDAVDVQRLSPRSL